MGELLGEIDLAEAVMSLELGPNVTITLQKLSAYMERVRGKHKEEEEKRAAGVEDDEGERSVETTMHSLGGLLCGLFPRVLPGISCGLKQDAGNATTIRRL